MSDRISYDDNGASLDEIVLSGVTFHMEAMGHPHQWWIGVTNAEGVDLHINFQVMGEPHVHDCGDQRIPVQVHEPLLFHEDSRWTGPHGVEHRCEIAAGRYASRGRISADTHKRCRCECGATRRRQRA